MRKTLMCIVLSGAAAIVGCTSATQIEWGGRTALRGPDGAVLLDKDGAPYYETGKNVYRDSNWLTKREERDVAVEASPDGSYSAMLGARSNDVSENGIRMVTGGLESLTRLVSTCAAAYATIAGGGAQVDTVATVVGRAVSLFVDRGGDASKASVRAEGGRMTISDGTTCVTCDASGNCTACSEAAAGGSN